jgi:hypothetical protein
MTTRTLRPTTCPFCATVHQTGASAKIAAEGVCCGSSECTAARNAMIDEMDAASRRRAAETRRERRSQPKPQPALGEWGRAVMLGRIGR